VAAGGAVASPSSSPQKQNSSIKPESNNNSFVYKLTTAKGKIVKISSSVVSFVEVRAAIAAKLGMAYAEELELAYKDEDGDEVALDADDDLACAVTMCGANKSLTVIIKTAGTV
jgi:hypothetical protein